MLQPFFLNEGDFLLGTSAVQQAATKINNKVLKTTLS